MSNLETRYNSNRKLLKALGNVLFKQRVSLDLTQEAVAKKSGLSWRYIQQVESARYASETERIKSVSFSVFVDLALAMELKPSTFLDEILCTMCTLD